MEQFDNVRPVLIIRNPFAVSLSKQKKPHWFFAADSRNIVDQAKLQEDFLHPHTDVIDRVLASDDPLMSHLLNWAIINMVPLRQFRRNELHLCFYEHAYLDPSVSMGALFEFVGHDFRSPDVELPARVIKRPSRMTYGDSTLQSAASPIAAWKGELTTSQIDEGFALLAEFGFDGVYGEDGMPRPAAFERFRPSE